jgi:hypothetical protein
MSAGILPSQEELHRRDEVTARILNAIRESEVIKLPDFKPANGQPPEFGPYSGTLGEYRYQFEGEEDLLHLVVTRQNGQPLSVEEAQTVTSFLYESVPKALIWLKPGEFSQHFYLGHDELLTYWQSSANGPSQGS